MSKRTLTLFLSSPGDCARERRAVERVVGKLLRDPYLKDRFHLQVEAWDTDGRTVPLVATRPPQESVDRAVKRPEDCDLFVGIFRGRMGTPLPREHVQKDDGSAYASGSEYEFHQAWKQALRTKGDKPYILLYRGPAGPRAEARQKKKVEAFFSSSWIKAIDGSQLGGFHTFKSTPDFADQLEHHLRTYLHEQAPWLRQRFDRWLQDGAERLARDAGPRFTPEAHVDTPPAKAFQWLLRLPQAFQELDAAVGNVFKAIRHIKELEPHQAELKRTALEFRQLKPWETPPAIQRLERVLRDLERSCEEQGGATRVELATAKQEEEAPPEATVLSIQGRMNALVNAGGECFQALRLIERNAPLLGSSALLLSGSAGQGKTHTLVEQVHRHLQRGGIALGVLGHQLSGAGDLWREILDRLQVASDTTPDQFLSELSAEAQRRGCVALIAFDALNETRDRKRWKDQLPGMLGQISRYPNLVVVFSVRDDYLDATLPRLTDDTGRPLWKRVELKGFAGVEPEALLKFFAAYNLDAPVLPPIVPELSNPLYLKLLCKSLQARRTHLKGHIPSWLDVRDNLLEHLESLALSDPLLEIAPTVRAPIRRTLDKLSEEMLTSGSLSLARTRAETLADSYAHGRFLISFLITNDVLFEIPAANSDEDHLQFAYERLSETFLAERLLTRIADADGHISQERLMQAFRPGGELHALIAEQPGRQLINRAGMLKATALLLPRKTGRELVEVLPTDIEFSKHRVAESFFDSLLWRNQREEFGVHPRHLVELLDQWEPWFPQSSARCLDFYIRLSLIPGHPLGARKFLHPGLASQGSPGRRDAFWSVRLPELWGDSESTLSLLLQWTDKYGFNRLEPEVAHPIALVLAWICTSSHTGQREAATQGLCRILHACPEIAEKVLTALGTVDDAYVVESVLRALLGVVEVRKERAWLGRMGRLVYQQQFPEGRPRWCHLMIRHYARSIVERTARAAKLGEPELSAVRPPHPSHLDLEHVPSKEELEALDESSGFQSIVASCMHRDFFLYELGGNSGAGKFLARPLPSSTEPARPYLKSESYWASRIQPEAFDISLMGRFIAQNCLALGWTAQRFDAFDPQAEANDTRISGAPRTERMGKKYQWISWRTLQAFLADHYFVSKTQSEEPKVYETPKDLWEELPAPSLWLIKPHRSAKEAPQEEPHLETTTSNIDPGMLTLPRPWPDPLMPSIQAWIEDPRVEPEFPSLLHLVPPEAISPPEAPWMRTSVELVWKRGWRFGQWAEPDFMASIWWLGRARVIHAASLKRMLERLRKPQIQERLRAIGRPEVPRDEDIPLDRWSTMTGELATGFIDAVDARSTWNNYFPVPYAHLFGELATHQRTITLPTPWIIRQWKLRLDWDAYGYRTPDGRLLFRNFRIAQGHDAVFASLPVLRDVLAASGWVLVWLIRGERHALMHGTYLGGTVNTHGVAWFDGENARLAWMHQERRLHHG